MFQVNGRARRVLENPYSYIILGGAILGADVITGPYLQFPILFTIPVFLAAWYCGSRPAYTMAIGLPAARFLLRRYVELPHPLHFMMANALIRMLVLSALAYLTWRTARQTAELKRRIGGYVTMCAWSRTIEFEGDWLSFEEYLKRRFGLDTTHGISPDQAQKMKAANWRPDEAT